MVADWSGRRDLNPRPSPWQGDALPLSYFRMEWCEGRDLNPYALRHEILNLACLPFHHPRMVRPVGFEPTTCGFEVRHSIP